VAVNVFAAELVRIAESQVGVREKGGNNRGPKIAEYQQSTWLPIGAWPWCAAFTAWCLRETLKNPEARHAAYLRDELHAERWRCKDAAAYGWEKWAREKKLQLLPETARALAGDFVTFDFSHIGIVVKDQLRAGAGVIHTVEGNTDSAGSREGGGVYAKERPWKLIRTLIRVPAR
jgi:hypothetical protein